MLALSGPFENTITTLRPGTLAASRKRQQQGVVERRIVAGDRLAQATDRFHAVLGEKAGAGQVAAERVDGDRIGAVEAAHEIGDGVFGVHEAAVHEVAGVEQDEDAGADEGVGARIKTGLAGATLFGGDERARRAVVVDGHGGAIALGEGRQFLRDAVFRYLEIRRLQTVDIVILAVGDGEAEHHHVDLDPEYGTVLSPSRQRRRGHRRRAN